VYSQYISAAGPDKYGEKEKGIERGDKIEQNTRRRKGTVYVTNLATPTREPESKQGKNDCVEISIKGGEEKSRREWGELTRNAGQAGGRHDAVKGGRGAEPERQGE